MEYVPCNLCQSTAFDPLYIHVPDLLLNRSEVCSTLVRCTTCGLIYQNPRPLSREMDQHYPEMYDWYGPALQKQGMSFLARMAYSYGFTRQAGYLLKYKTGGRLLDVGCSVGLFLMEMRRNASWQVSGLEINHTAAEIARLKNHLHVITGTLETAALPAQEYDAVTVWNVLEHLADPCVALQEIHHVLKDDGVLVIRVPNAASWEAAWFGATWAGLDLPRHLFVFDLTTLTQLLRKTGFRVIASDRKAGSYTNFLLSLRFWLTNRNPSADPSQNSLLKFLSTPFMRLLASPFFFVPGIFQKGPLLTVTAIKSR